MNIPFPLGNLDPIPPLWQDWKAELKRLRDADKYALAACNEDHEPEEGYEVDAAGTFKG